MRGADVLVRLRTVAWSSGLSPTSAFQVRHGYAEGVDRGDHVLVQTHVRGVLTGGANRGRDLDPAAVRQRPRFFSSFALNQWLQYRQIDPWKNYLTGERTYIVLSLIAKSTLAWQIFANTLIG